MNGIIGKENVDCSGCLACANVCRVNAITIRKDREGFYYPFIMTNRCTQCNRCFEVCENTKKEQKETCNKFYFAKHMDLQEQKTSQSGGAFWAIAQYIFDKGGIVYGASFDNSFRVRHIRTKNKTEGKRLKGSKYVQSYIGRTYRKVALDLKNQKDVLFSGTPCQIAGLYAFLKIEKIETNRLLTCDLICHGTPSPKIWEDYLLFIEKKYHQTISNANFRDKSFGWGTHIESFTLMDSTKKSTVFWGELLYSHYTLHPACGKCRFSNCNRVGDITLGDCWGIGKYHPRFFDKNGVSLLLINSRKGRHVLENINPYLQYRTIEPRYILQPTLKEPYSVPLMEREKFWNAYRNKGLRFILRRYTSYGLMNKISFKVKEIIENYLK